jgi:hypothetical protein
LERKKYSRLVKYPTAFPRATGMRMAAAGLLKTAAGMVIDGIYVVILFTIFEINLTVWSGKNLTFRDDGSILSF